MGDSLLSMGAGGVQVKVGFARRRGISASVPQPQNTGALLSGACRSQDPRSQLKIYVAAILTRTSLNAIPT
jgi:hypothetical protein